MSTSSLPPEVLHEILQLLPPSQNGEFPFDLLSASLTCPAWRAAARLYFDPHHICHLLENHDQNLSEIARVSALLVESRRLGANDGDLIEEITIRTSRALFASGQLGDEAVRCVGSIFKQARNLAGLRLRFKRSNCSEGDMARLCQCIEPSCGKIQRLSLIAHPALGLSGWQIGLSTSNLVSRMTNLTDFELFQVSPISALATALSGLACIERARFTAFEVTDVHQCVTGWPALRSLLIEMPRNGSCDALWREVGRSCPRLQELTYIRVPGERGCVTRDKGEIAGVVEQCSELEVLDISGNEGLDDEFLKRIMRAGCALRQFVLDGCHNILTTPGGEWAAIERPWPKIESIDISNCWGFTEKFVDKIMRECPTLQAIILPKQLEVGSCQVLLKSYGFQRKDRARIWNRC